MKSGLTWRPSSRGHKHNDNVRGRLSVFIKTTQHTDQWWQWSVVGTVTVDSLLSGSAVVRLSCCQAQLLSGSAVVRLSCDGVATVSCLNCPTPSDTTPQRDTSLKELATQLIVWSVNYFIDQSINSLNSSRWETDINKHTCINMCVCFYWILTVILIHYLNCCW